MRGFTVVLALCLVVLVQESFASKEMLMAMMKNCKEESGASDDELEKLFSGKATESDEVKKMAYCMMKMTNMVKFYETDKRVC